MSLRPFAALLLALAAFLPAVGLAQSASAHASLVSSDPKDGAELDSSPSAVTLTFNEDVATPAQLEVTGPGGDTLADGDPAVEGKTVRQQVQPAEESGTYTIAYRVVSADGHPVTGELSYSVAGGAPSPEAPADDAESFLQRHGTHLALGAAAVVVAAVLLLWPWIRRRA